MKIVLATNMLYDIYELSKQVALKFGVQFENISATSLHKNAGVFTNPPSKNAVYSGIVFAHKFDSDSIKVYLKIGEEELIDYIMEKNNLSFDDAKEYIRREEDKIRDENNKFFGIDIRDMSVYDLVINTQRLDCDGIISIIQKYASKIKKG